MTEFPWATLITAVSAVALASIPLIVSLSADARYQKTLQLLEATVITRPGSPAERALSDALDLMAARKLAKLEYGLGTWLYIGSVASAAIFVGGLNGAYALSDTNQWITGIGSVAFAVLYGATYWSYLSTVRKALAKAASSEPAAGDRQLSRGASKTS